MASPQLTRSTVPFPTVLVAGLDETVSSTLCDNLRKDRLHVLEANCWSAALDLIQRHSRQIHVLVTDAMEEHSDLVTRLKRYRPDMQILFIGIHTNGTIPNVVRPDSAVAQIRELLKPR
jgi:DNA-binding NtrC family response regulator